MKTYEAAIFKELSRNAEGLAKTMATFLPATQQLGDSLTQSNLEGEQTRQEFIQGFQKVVDQVEDDQAGIKVDQEQNREVLLAYLAMVQLSTQGLVEGLAGSQADISGLLEVFIRGFDEQGQNLRSASEIETQLDRNRLDSYLKFGQTVRQTEQLLKGLRDNLDHVVGAEAQLLQVQREKGLEANRQVVHQINQRALQMYARGNINVAAWLLKQLITMPAQDAQVYLNLAGIEAVQGELEQATEHFLKAVEMGCNEQPTRFVQAVIAYQNGDFVQACQCLEDLLRLPCSPADELEIRLLLAQVNNQLGKPLQAIENWRRVLEIDPGHAIAQAWLWAMDAIEYHLIMEQEVMA